MSTKRIATAMTGTIEIPDDIDVDAELEILAELAHWHESSAQCNMMFDAAAMAAERSKE